MRFKEKASSIALAAILMATSIAPVNAYMKEEIVGRDRYETAAKVADRMYNYDKVILVNGNSIADGLSASGLAGKENAPILLVKKDSIPKETLQRLYKVKKVYIIGKENAISARVESTLKSSGKTVKRIGGSNRIDTSVAVSKEIGSYSKAFLVNGFKGEADAMSVSSVAARDKAPIILTNGKINPVSKKSGVKYYVVGGNAVMGDSIKNSFSAERLSGSNRYTTNKVVVKKFYPNTDKLYFAKGDGLVDALTVSPLAKNTGLALVSENSDKSIFYKKEKLVQVGGMSRSIVDKVIDSIYNEAPAKPDNKPNENKPDNKPDNKPNENKPDNKPANKPENPVIPPEDTQKPSEKTYDINSPEFQSIVRKEFYRLLDAHRAANGVVPIKHHWACEESSMIKSKDMIEKGYYGHDGGVKYPHLISKAENIAANWYTGDVTEAGGKKLARELFTMWKNSPGHNEIMLMDTNDFVNNDIDIDGFSFYAKESYYGDSFGPATPRRLAKSGKIYMIKATYHSATTHKLWDTPETTNPSSPGYQGK